VLLLGAAGYWLGIGKRGRVEWKSHPNFPLPASV
jgi:hypothetical protein